MKTFKYTWNHKEDEAYMAKMCQKGWAALRLVEGIWTFEPCEPGQYTYRVAYLRTKTKEEVEDFKMKLAQNGIEFVSRYSFWAIFRSEQDFKLYKEKEERKICESIFRPMPIGAVLSGFLCVLFLYLSIKINTWFILFSILLGIYCFVCTRLALSYKHLIQSLEK